MQNSFAYYVYTNIFIVASILYLILWDTNSKRIIPILRPIIIYLGLWHSWCMFSNPSRVTDRIYAEILHDDGTTKRIEIYDAASLSFMGDSAKNIRIVKIAENIVQEDSLFKEYFTDYLYRKYKKNNIQEISLYLDRTLMPSIKPKALGTKIQKLYTYKA